MVWTVFEYVYRDAANFKAFGFIALEGRVTGADLEFIRGKLDSREYFIAEQIGVPPLYDKLYQLNGGPTDADHCWHEFVGFRELAAPTCTRLSKRDFMARFAAVETWNQELSPHFRLADPIST